MRESNVVHIVLGEGIERVGPECLASILTICNSLTFIALQIAVFSGSWSPMRVYAELENVFRGRTLVKSLPFFLQQLTFDYRALYLTRSIVCQITVEEEPMNHQYPDATLEISFYAKGAEGPICRSKICVSSVNGLVTSLGSTWFGTPTIIKLP